MKEYRKKSLQNNTEMFIQVKTMLTKGAVKDQNEEDRDTYISPGA